MGYARSCRRLDITDEAYFADPCERPSLSNSLAKVLLDKSPRHAWQVHPRLGAAPREDSKTFDRGHLVHKLVLGKGADITVVEAKDWRTKGAQEQRDEAYAAGRIPVLVADLAGAEEAASAIAGTLARQGLRLSGESEVKLTWLEEVPGHDDVHARGMVDHLVVGKASATIVDLKTSRSAHPRACAAHVVEYGYDTQRAAYTCAVETLLPELAGRVDFVFVFAEVEPPYAVTTGRLDGVLCERGRRRWDTAVELWAQCLAADSWPTYADRPITIEAPSWVLGSLPEAP